MSKLFLCNTSYQILVAMWITYRYLPEDEVDLIITDHFVGSSELVSKAKSCGLFKQAYYARTLAFNRHSISYTKGQDILHLVFRGFGQANGICCGEVPTQWTPM